MASLNKVQLIGNLGRDPESRSTQGGQKIVSFRLATSENWKDRATGERKERTEWHSVVIFNENLADIAERYLRKGSTVYVEGQLQTRKWTDQSGQERYTTEVVLSRFKGELTLLGGRATANNTGGDERPPRRLDEELDDEIPFAWLGALIAPALALLAAGGLA